MRQIEIQVPDGVCGDYRVETFTVSKNDSRFTSYRPNGYVPAGTYKRLMRGCQLVMSNTPIEVDSNRVFISWAKGKVLINGLGLGMVLTEIFKKEEVTEVTVVEISEEVINLVGTSFKDDPRVNIIHADALEYKPPKGKRFDCVWHDIWDNICVDNLSEMSTLHRRYGRRTDWQESWQKDLCKYYRDRDKSRGGYW